MKKFFALCLAFVLLLQTGCGTPNPTKYQRVDTAMGTVVSMTVYTTGSQEILDELFDGVKELEQDTLSRRIPTSEIGRANAMSGQEEIALSELCGKTIETCLQIAEDADGAFQPALGNLITLWNIDEQAQGPSSAAVIPTEAEIAEALEHCDYHDIKLNREQDIYRLSLENDVQIDLGAVGKGLALDVLRELLEKSKVSGATVSVGGSVLVYGEKPDEIPWKVGIVNPLAPGESLGILTVPAGQCVSTSGDYERYIEADGKRYHHILDSSTGYPAESGVRSVTILCENGMISDALSTACFVLGTEEGLKLAAKYNAEVLFVTESGEMVMSDGMKGYFTAK